MWKSVTLNFAQLSLNLTLCAASQADIEPRHSGLVSTLKPFGLSSAAWYTTVIPENSPRDPTSKPRETHENTRDVQYNGGISNRIPSI